MTGGKPRCRLCAFLCTLAVFLCAFTPVPARAAPEDYVNVVAQMIPSGEMQMLHVQIYNSAENSSSLENVRVVTDSGVFFTFDIIVAGSMDMSTGAYYGAYQPDGSVNITVLWFCAGQEHSIGVNVPATGTSGQTISPVIVECVFPIEVSVGQELTLSYMVRNTGKTDIEQITLSDEMIGEGIGELARVTAGSSGVIELEYTVMGDLISKPSITYMSGGEWKTYEGEEKTMEVTVAPIKVEATAEERDYRIGDAIAISVWLDNTTGYDYKNIVVNDAILGEVYTLDVLYAGESKSFVLDLTVEGARTYIFIVRAENESGTQITSRSIPLVIKAYDDSGTLAADVSITVTPEAPALMSPAAITFRVLVRNRSDQAVTDMTVSERTLGKVGARAQMNAGVDYYFDFPVDVTASTEYLFQLDMTLPDGSRKTVTAAPFTVRVGRDAVAPMGVSGETTHVDLEDVPFLSIAFPEMETFIGIFYTGVAIIAVLLALALILFVLIRLGRLSAEALK